MLYDCKFLSKNLSCIIFRFQSAYSSYGGVQGTYNRYGYESQDQNQNGNDEKVNFGGCDSFNVNQPYCSRYPEECRKYFDECMKIAQGTGCKH